MATIDRFRVDHYGTRFFAVYDGEELVAVTDYRKGAEEVKRRLIFFEKKSKKTLTRRVVTGIVPSMRARIHSKNACSRKCQTLGVPRQSRGFT